MAEGLIDAVEPAKEAANIVADVVSTEAVRQMVSLRRAYVALTMGTVGGVMMGWGLATKRLATKYQHYASPEEIEEIRTVYHKEALREQTAKPPLEEVARISEEARYTKHDNVTSKEVAEEILMPATQNIFENASTDGIPPWDYSAERKHRDGTVPYVIHRDEFENFSAHYEKSTLTYFEGDDVLVDEQSQMIGDMDEVVGLGNLERFGHGSGDPMIVFIANETLEHLYEVVRSSDSYSSAVHGVQEDDELRHSASMRRRRPRDFREE